MKNIYIAETHKTRPVTFTAHNTREAVARAQGIANTANARVILSQKICSRLRVVSTIRPR